MNQSQLQISDRVLEIPEALSIYINQLAYDQRRKGRDITVLSLGEAFFNIPLFDFSKLDYVSGQHYSDSRGVLELRKEITLFYQTQYNAGIDLNNEIIISAGSKPIIFFAMQAVLNPEDEIIIHEPGWLSYQEQARIIGAKPTFIPYDAKIPDFHQYFTNKTRMLVINNPNNPSGKLYSKEELLSIYDQCRSRGIYVLVDEAYSDFVIDETFHSMVTVAPDKEGIIVVNSLSKNMGMSGWRVGYVITSSTLIKQILKLNQHIITCAPTILQFYMAKYFKQITEITLPQALEVVEKRKRISIQMDKLNIKYLPGSATFYFMVNIEEFPASSLEFALYLLLEYQISVVPGSAYGKSTDRFIRVGIGAESEERIYNALKIIKNIIKASAFSKSYITQKTAEENIHLFEEIS